MLTKLVKAQFAVLLAGTVFAWVNFGLELDKWAGRENNAFACSLGVSNPFLTPCFYGALFFTLAFVLSVFILRLVIRKSSNQQT